MDLNEKYVIVPINGKSNNIPPIPILNISGLQGPTFENICTPRCGISRFCPETHDRVFMIIEK